ncbi:hypothetical protein N869_14840 [Cellulomonas bogoriensis 69B4 = DSM 16987]|uniref:Uncharacterized protein n=2 Tax=Cellulomonas bogoriensis TaxID=301388 RepID=A0A0A0C1U0_9CELL|nr:hypothetical protein N869_14840 [Cellulomonas bogoriensis 69B4 = DSM 16987]
MIALGPPATVTLGLATLAMLVLACRALWAMLLRPRGGRIEVLATSRGLELPAAAGIRPVVVAAPWFGLVAAALMVFAGALGYEAVHRVPGHVAGLVLGVFSIGVLLLQTTYSATLVSMTLTPHGIVRHGLKHDTVVPWEEVFWVTIVTRPGIHLRIGHRAGADRHKPVVIPLALLDSDPRLVVAVVEHYRRHRKHRAELADGTAVSRIERGELKGLRRGHRPVRTRPGS